MYAVDACHASYRGDSVVKLTYIKFDTRTQSPESSQRLRPGTRSPARAIDQSPTGATE